MCGMGDKVHLLILSAKANLFSEKNRKIGQSPATILISMAETMPPHDSEEPKTQSIGVAVDWSARLAEHDRCLRTVVLARLGEHPAVDEAVQEVALVAVAQQPPLADLSRLRPWLHRAA